MGPAAVALLKTLLPLFVAGAIPVFIFVTAKDRDFKALFRGIVIGIMTYVIVRFFMDVI